MKIKIRSQDASTLNMDGWLQMDGVDEWLAELRVDGRPEPTTGPAAGPASTEPSAGPATVPLAEPQAGPVAGDADDPDAADTVRTQRPDLARLHARAEARAGAEVRAWAQARAYADARARAEARTAAPAPLARPDPGDIAWAVIGDELRIPVMWCEMGSCVAWYADRAALGEAVARARAISAGWCLDAVGRLACPRCQQDDPCFWTPAPVVPWDHYLAMARAARAAGATGQD